MNDLEQVWEDEIVWQIAMKIIFNQLDSLVGLGDFEDFEGETDKVDDLVNDNEEVEDGFLVDLKSKTYGY